MTMHHASRVVFVAATALGGAFSAAAAVFDYLEGRGQDQACVWGVGAHTQGATANGHYQY